MTQQFDPGMLPPQPTIIPPELASAVVDNTAGGDWQSRVPAEAVGMFVAAIARWLSHPRFGVRVQVDTETHGWVLRISTQPPVVREDVLLADE